MSDVFLAKVDAALGEVAASKTVDDVITALNRYFEKSQGDAFFPCGSCDRTLHEELAALGWTTLWMKASYFYVVEDPAGNIMTYIEGDVIRGDHRSR